MVPKVEAYYSVTGAPFHPVFPEIRESGRQSELSRSSSQSGDAVVERYAGVSVAQFPHFEGVRGLLIDIEWGAVGWAAPAG